MKAMTSARMKLWTQRPLTKAERDALSAGLWSALTESGVQPLIVARPSLPALIVSVWRGGAPVMVLGRRIYWPGALTDFAARPELMSVLQHELQHALEFGRGELSRLSYLLKPTNWIYRYRLGAGALWSDFGAEQRAMIVQHYFLAERGLLPSAEPVETYQALIPWARKEPPCATTSA